MGTPVCFSAWAAAFSTTCPGWLRPSCTLSLLATLMIPALIPVPSIPSWISLINSWATSVGSTPQKMRGMSTQNPVAAMTLTPVLRDTSSVSRMSRPKSNVVTSTMVCTPSLRASVSRLTALSITSAR